MRFQSDLLRCFIDNYFENNIFLIEAEIEENEMILFKNILQ